jgi:hypothetical protein
MKHSEMQTGPLSIRKICNFDDKIKVISILSDAPRHENILENEGVPPRFLVSLGIIVTEFTLQSLHPQGKKSRCPFYGIWVLPRDTLDNAERRNVFYIYRESN